jgi:hypothetical protein
MPLYHCRLINTLHQRKYIAPSPSPSPLSSSYVCVGVCLSGALRRELHQRC